MKPTLSGSHVRFTEEALVTSWKISSNFLHQKGRGMWGRKKPFHSEETACADASDSANKNKGCSVKLEFQINHKQLYYKYVTCITMFIWNSNYLGILYFIWQSYQRHKRERFRKWSTVLWNCNLEYAWEDDRRYILNDKAQVRSQMTLTLYSKFRFFLNDNGNHQIVWGWGCGGLIRGQIF